MFTAPLLLGCLLAPWIYQGVPALQGERFERVASRTVQVLALLMIWPCMRWAGAGPEIVRGMGWSRDRARRFRDGFLTGLLSIAACYGLGLGLGAYKPEVEHYTAGLPLVLLGFLSTAFFVGWLEEIFFRVFFQGSLRTRWPRWATVLLVSAVFAALHFFRPRVNPPITQPDWSSGFALLPHLFALFEPDRDLFFAATLFLMSLALALYYEREGHLYHVAGLHMGWVLMLQAGDHLVDRVPGVHDAWFGQGDLISRAPAALPVIALFVVAALLALPKARQGSTKDGP